MATNNAINLQPSANGIVYASDASDFSTLASVNSGVLTTNGSGVPTWINAKTSFTPAFAGAGANPTSITYSAQVGNYTQVGNIIFYTVSIKISAVTLGGASGNLQVTGLPVVAANGPVPAAVVLNNIATTGTPVCVTGAVENNTSHVIFYESYNNGASATIPVTVLTSNSQFYIAGFYFTA